MSMNDSQRVVPVFRRSKSYAVPRVV
jgi:hypothetical protein